MMFLSRQPLMSTIPTYTHLRYNIIDLGFVVKVLTLQRCHMYGQTHH